VSLFADQVAPAFGRARWRLSSGCDPDRQGFKMVRRAEPAPPIGLDVTRRKVAARGWPRHTQESLTNTKLFCSDDGSVINHGHRFQNLAFFSRKFGMRVAFCSCEPSYTNDEQHPCLPSVSSVRRRRRRADAHCRHLLRLPLRILRLHVDGTILAAQRGSPSSAASVVKRCAVFAAARRMCCRRLVDGMTC